MTARLTTEETLAGTLLMVRFADVLPLQEGKIAESAHQMLGESILGERGDIRLLRCGSMIQDAGRQWEGKDSDIQHRAKTRETCFKRPRMRDAER